MSRLVGIVDSCVTVFLHQLVGMCISFAAVRLLLPGGVQRHDGFADIGEGILALSGYRWLNGMHRKSIVVNLAIAIAGGAFGV